MRHAGPLALFATLAVAWTWPLAAHLGSVLPGQPGDNYMFLWDVWWARTAFDTPGLPYFRTTSLFYPFGIDMVGESHVALPGFAAATLLRPLSPAAAHDALLIAFVFANLAAMYALAWDLTRHRRASVIAAIVFGWSPYLAAHAIGHLELLFAWPIPLFALLLRRALNGSNAAVFGAASVAVMTAYTLSYYVVYLGLLATVVMACDVNPFTVVLVRRAETPTMRRRRRVALGGAAAMLALAAWISVTGGVDRTSAIGISMTRPQNPLTAAWLLALVAAFCTWRAVPTRTAGVPRERSRRVAAVAAGVGVLFAVGAAPMAIEAATLIARGEYVTQTYSWLSAPRGVDAATFLLGPPSHPLVRAAVHRVYAAMHVDSVEAVGWIGAVPLALLIASRRTPAPETRLWWTIVGVFVLLALGPYFTVAGVDTGLRLPAIFLRFIPIVANARMPGRLMVVADVGIAALCALAVARARGRWLSRPAAQWLIGCALVFEFWNSPMPVTWLDRPRVYQALAQQPPGAVCEAPFGVGDGLGTGAGSQDRSVLYYATLHGHPLVGGFVARMPRATVQRYERMAVVGDLLRLSSNLDVVDPRQVSEPSPCRYLVVRWAGLSAPLSAYIHGLPLEPIAADATFEVFRLEGSAAR